MQYGQQSMDPPPSSIIGGQLQGYGGIGHVSVMVCVRVSVTVYACVCLSTHMVYMCATARVYVIIHCL